MAQAARPRRREETPPPRRSSRLVGARIFPASPPRLSMADYGDYRFRKPAAYRDYRMCRQLLLCRLTVPDGDYEAANPLVVLLLESDLGFSFYVRHIDTRASAAERKFVFARNNRVTQADGVLRLAQIATVQTLSGSASLDWRNWRLSQEILEKETVISFVKILDFVFLIWMLRVFAFSGERDSARACLARAAFGLLYSLGHKMRSKSAFQRNVVRGDLSTDIAFPRVLSTSLVEVLRGYLLAPLTRMTVVNGEFVSVGPLSLEEARLMWTSENVENPRANGHILQPINMFVSLVDSAPVNKLKLRFDLHVVDRDGNIVSAVNEDEQAEGDAGAAMIQNINSAT